MSTGDMLSVLALIMGAPAAWAAWTALLRRRRAPWLVVSLLSTVACWGAIGTIRMLLSHAGFVVAVAPYAGPRGETSNLGSQLAAGVRDSLAEYPEVRIKLLRESLPEGTDSLQAERVARREKADVLVWGWYGLTSKRAVVTTYLRVARSRALRVGVTMSPSPYVASREEFDTLGVSRRLTRGLAGTIAFVTGMAEYERGHIGTAADRLARAIRAGVFAGDSSSAGVAYFYLASALDDEGRQRESLAALDSACTLSPDLAEAYLDRARLREGLVGDTEAGNDYEMAVRLARDPALRGTAFLGRATFRQRQDRLAQALVDADSAVGLLRGYAPALYIKWMVLSKMGRRDECARALDACIGMAPRWALPLVTRGSIRQGEGDPYGAVEDYSRAIEGLGAGGTSPEGYVAEIANAEVPEEVAYGRRASAYLATGDTASAMRDLNLAVGLNPTPVLVLSRAGLLIVKGELGRALSDCDAVVQQFPRLAVGWAQRAAVHGAMGDRMGSGRDWLEVKRLGGVAELGREADSLARSGSEVPPPAWWSR